MGIRDIISKVNQILKVYWWDKTTPVTWRFDVDQFPSAVREFDHDGGGVQLFFRRGSVFYYATTVYENGRAYIGPGLTSKVKLPLIAQMRSRNAPMTISQKDKDFMSSLGRPVDLPVKEYRVGV